MSDVGKSLIQGVEEALEYAKGINNGARAHKVKVPAEIDVSAIRKKLDMSRQEFSAEFGFSIRTLEKWERGERLPEGPTRAYLTVIEKNPNAVIAALQQAS
jgi:putative transcriptional regulator